LSFAAGGSRPVFIIRMYPVFTGSHRLPACYDFIVTGRKKGFIRQK